VFVPEFNNNIAVSYCDVHLSSVLSYKVLYSWGNNEDVGRKVIVISSCVLEDIDSVTKIALLDAADKCVSVDFVLLEKVSGSRSSLLESIDNFNRNICDLENCSFRNHLLGSLRSLVKRKREHAEKFMGYQNKRGGNVKLQSILMPSSKFDHAEKGDALYGKSCVIVIFCEFLGEQVEAIKKISEYVAQLRRIGKGHGVWHFDQMLLNEEAAI
nr:ferritin-3, chloroplastic [Tanacetum cinerariifolium]